jgi:hypothetical protein
MSRREAEAMFKTPTPAPEALPLEELGLLEPEVPSRACCCPAKPAVRAMMPPAQGRPHPVDLWLCAHHYLGARGALDTAHATVEDLATVLAPTGPDAPPQRDHW